MRNVGNSRNSQRRRSTSRKNFLRLERLEDRLALATASPVAVNDFYHDLVNQPLTIAPAGVLANDISSSGGALTAGWFSGPAHGSLDFNDDGSFIYSPEADFVGLDTFMYFANDGASDSMLAAVTIDVGDGGPPPDAVDDVYSVDEDGTLSVAFSDGVLANDTVTEGQSLSAAIVSGPTNGTLSLGDDGSLMYVPNANFNGSDTFTYSATDDAGDSDVATVTITVNAVNDKPTAANDSFPVGEDTTLTIGAASGLLMNDADLDGDTLTPTVTLQPLHGTLVLNGDGSFTYTPEANYNGLDGFSYLVSDGTDTSDVASATIVVSPANDLPVGVNDEYTTEEDTPLEIAAPGVLVNDTDVDGDALASILVNPPQHGSVTLSADGSLIYTPAANFNGVDAFSYLANDGSGDSDATAVTINVTPVNDMPTLTADSYSTEEDTLLTIDAAAGVLANDSDADGDPMTLSLVDGPINGGLMLNTDGSFSYTPNANFHGTDTFTYQVTDGTVTTDPTTVTIEVASVNDAPIAAADGYSLAEDTSLVVEVTAGVLHNDSDVDGDPMTAAVVAAPANGTLTLNADGSFNYVPNANWSGSDSFTYQATDGLLNSEATTVTIDVTPVNDAPVSAADEYNTAEDVPLTVSAEEGVLANDSDADGDTMTVSLVSGTTNGALTLNADGSFNYVPNANFNGSDSFVYQATDGTVTADPTTVTIDICPANDAPTTADDAYSLDEETTLTVDALTGVLANDSDIDGDSLTASVVSGPTNGSVTLNADGSFSYVPNANFSGADSFVYAASDGSLQTQATVSLTVNPIAEAPIPATDNYSTGEDVPLTISVGMGVLANDLNPEGGEMTAEVVTGPAHGALTLNADGSFSFTPEVNFHGNDSFTYKAKSNGQEMVSAANIVIEPLNDAPVAANDEFDIPAEDEGALAANVLANDSDIDGDAMTVNLVSGPSNGTLTLNPDGTFSYAAQEGFEGDDTFKYQLFDGKANSNVATVTLHVAAESTETPPEETPPPTETPPVENLRPLAVNDVFTTPAGTTLNIAATAGLLANDSDPEGGAITASLFGPALHGSVTVQDDGSFSYTPESGYVGMDAFLYRTHDGTNWSAVAAVTVHVTPVDGPDETPTPNPDPEPTPTPTPTPGTDPEPCQPVPCHPQPSCHVGDGVLNVVVGAHFGHHSHLHARAVDSLFGHRAWWK
jgi:VCBS repeat-containing protein